jgi:hypothetical protein
MGISTPRTSLHIAHRRPQQRAQWLRCSIADVAGHGHAVDLDDLAALPEDVQAEALTIAQHAQSLYRAGMTAAALEGARTAIEELNTRIDEDWTPPDERPDQDIIDSIPRRR